MEQPLPWQDSNFKALLKVTLAELLCEKPELFQPILEDVFEDMGLGRAMEAGLKGDYVPESEVRQLLNPSG